MNNELLDAMREFCLTMLHNPDKYDAEKLSVAERLTKYIFTQKFEIIIPAIEHWNRIHPDQAFQW